MSKRLWVAIVLAGAMVSAAVPLWAKDKPDAQVTKKGDNLVEVTVTGSGMDKDEAVLDAKRNAIEYGAGADLFSHTEVKDFVLSKDTVIARAAGFVQAFDVLSTRTSDDGLVTVKIKATVSIKGIEDTWGVVQAFLKELGRPKVMVFINEKVDDRRAELSTVQTKIEELLLKNGFDLVDQKQIKEIDKKDLSAAVAEDKPDRAQAIAKRFGAQLFITGHVDALIGEAKRVSGIPIYTYGAKGNIRCFLSNSAKMVSARNANAESADRKQNVAGDKSLVVLGDKMGPMVQQDVLRHWLDNTTGGGEVQLKVDDVNFKQNLALKKALKELKEIQEVNGEFANNTSELRIQTTLTGEKLAEKLADAIPDLDITDVSGNVIKGKMKK